MTAYRAPKGTADILPQDIAVWRKIEHTATQLCALYNFEEIRTPVFESTDLFLRGVGDTTDVVQKEMYTFLDKASRSLSLRPEGTASAVRAYLENSLFNRPAPTKLFYLITCYRYEDTQLGRRREFHQFGAEIFGSSAPSSDVEIISLINEFFRLMGLAERIKLKISSIGCPKCRHEYQVLLKKYLVERAEKLCPTCLERLDKNPLRVLDCKTITCKQVTPNAPKLLYQVCEDCGSHFKEVMALLNALKCEYIVDDTIVRGLDYYTKTVFEFVTDTIGAQGTVCGGGRYDNLIETLGGKPTPGIGFAMGIERLLLMLKSAGLMAQSERSVDIFIGNINRQADALVLTQQLRELGVRSETDHCGRSLKAQMKYADKIGAKYVLVLGEDEIETAQLKNMADGTKTEVSLSPKTLKTHIKQNEKP